MKICFINAWGSGSTGRLVEQLAKKCESEGDKYISFFGRGKSYLDDAICYNTKVSLYCDALFSRIFDNQGLNSTRQTKRMIKKIEAFKPDIIHIHNLHGYWINYRLLFDYIKKKKIKVVWTLHDSWPMTGHCACYSYLNCKHFNYGCGNCPGRKEYPSAWVDRSQKNVMLKSNVFSSVDYMTIVTPSEWMKKNVEGSILSKYPIKVICNQIDKSVFCYQKDSTFIERWGIPKNKKIVLYIAMSTSDPWKGFTIFRDVIELLPGNYHVVIVGECNLVNSDNLGRINDPSVLAKIYSTSDVLANPSLDDNYPTVNLEALACGVPVAAFEIGGIPEQINDSCGKITQEKTAKALLSSIIILTNCNRDSMRMNCLQRYTEISCSVNNVQEYYAIFCDMLMEESK